MRARVRAVLEKYFKSMLHKIMLYRTNNMGSKHLISGSHRKAGFETFALLP